MKRFIFIISIGLALTDYRIANAISSAGYGLIEESLSLTLSLASLVLAILIFQGLRGGDLGRPWLLISAGFALASAASLISLVDLQSFIVNKYDLRLALLVTRIGALLLVLLGLIFYKKELQ
jgi:hypothetical protein